MPDSIRSVAGIAEIPRGFGRLAMPNLTTSIMVRKERMDVRVLRNFQRAIDIKDQEVLLDEQGLVMMNDLLSAL